MVYLSKRNIFKDGCDFRGVIFLMNLLADFSFSTMKISIPYTTFLTEIGKTSSGSLSPRVVGIKYNLPGFGFMIFEFYLL